MSITQDPTAPALTEPAFITQARSVLDQGFFSDLNEEAHTPIDAQTANVMVMVWEALSPRQQATVIEANLPVTKFAAFAWKVTK